MDNSVGCVDWSNIANHRFCSAYQTLVHSLLQMHTNSGYWKTGADCFWFHVRSILTTPQSLLHDVSGCFRLKCSITMFGYCPRPVLVQKLVESLRQFQALLQLPLQAATTWCDFPMVEWPYIAGIHYRLQIPFRLSTAGLESTSKHFHDLHIASDSTVLYPTSYNTISSCPFIIF